MPVKTRAMMEEEMKKLFGDLAAQIKMMEDEVKTGQDELKAEIKATNAGQEELKTGMKATQEKIEGVMEELQEQFTKEIKNCQDQLRDEIKDSLGRVEKEIDYKIQGMEENIDSKIQGVEKKFEERLKALETSQVKTDTVSNTSCFAAATSANSSQTTQSDSLNTMCPPSSVLNNRPQHAIKTGTYDGKSTWSVFKQQFELIADYNQWDNFAKAIHLAAALRGEAADVLQTVPAERRSQYTEILNALDLRFGEQHMKEFYRIQLKSRQQKSEETLQELASDVERLVLFVYSDCPADVRDGLAMQHFVDAIKDFEVQQTLRISECKDLKASLAYALKVQAALESSRKNRRMVRCVEINEDPEMEICSILRRLEQMMNQKEPKSSKIKCWSCGEDGHTKRRCYKGSGGENNQNQQQLNE